MARALIRCHHCWVPVAQSQLQSISLKCEFFFDLSEVWILLQRSDEQSFSVKVRDDPIALMERSLLEKLAYNSVCKYLTGRNQSQSSSKQDLEYLKGWNLRNKPIEVRYSDERIGVQISTECRIHWSQPKTNKCWISLQAHEFSKGWNSAMQWSHASELFLNVY